jgi:hypothetical protein
MTPTHINGHSPNTEIVRLSELRKKVIQPIFELRNPDAMPEYRKALAEYEKLRKDRPEKTWGGESWQADAKWNQDGRIRPSDFL